ncbi:squalene-hopene/tetraprenyl-beta-curcumene cyclase [Enhydrobacter aerosaccus]|uniref:Squalene-hopene/tetraprenyl-beta-curcumene cyclase n=1 Tax=Enhydrobacter aerosaccus TaxID=225324 RepID=A0A1T4NU00_9HYPH|nr:squalene--hopene cyclase [Enhydrobacter aerosaccus]SJZ82721.1 squalene-hopene/tetraprenyl-beta-curcumene cyclase [Enhydrobacter aerosaccus]
MIDISMLEADIQRATEALLRQQRQDGHWVFELEADATIPSEYVLLRQYLGEPDAPELERKIGVYLRRIQGDHGGWPLFHDGAFDLSASVKAYFCLKMIGDDPQAPHMVRARAAILAQGGAAKANVFTRILLAQFGELSWNHVPTMPVEMILLPRWFPIHLSRMSYWARTVIVPLLVLAALRRRARNPRKIGIPELFAEPSRKVTRERAATHQKRAWALFFNGLDWVLKRVEPLWPKSMRRRAIDRCVAFVSERLNGEDGLGAIYPAMANSVMMFDALGYPPEHPLRAIARRSVEKLLVIREEEAYCQPCVSPVWDTALAVHAMLEVGGEKADEAARHGLEWLKPLQELEVKGDWAERRPDVRPGGWAFQYRNAHYPDLDDTAVVVMAMDRARREAAGGKAYDEPVSRAVEWTVGLQSQNGGWGAFDADNVDLYLNNIPFADHGALLDPPTADVSARCISMLAQLGQTPESPQMKAALAYLERDQEADGSWFGRWGVNYIYGTWSALCALNAAGFDGARPSVRKAADWLIAIQNADGGWGEDCTSYKLDYKGHEPAPSNASQTAWALLGLMAAGEADHPAVERGIGYLSRTQTKDGLWSQDAYTGGGFPRVFYLRYHGYPNFFPLWALARYRNLKRANSRRVAYGM